MPMDQYILYLYDATAFTCSQNSRCYFLPFSNVLQQYYVYGGSTGQPTLLSIRATPESVGTAQKVSCLHRMTALTSSFNKIGECELADNKPANEIATAIAEGVRLYNQRFHRNSRYICIVISERSSANDDRLIEAALLINHGIASHRRTARELAKDIRMEEKVVTVTSVLDSSRRFEVGLFYFQPDSLHLDDDQEVQLRLKIERSIAVKCPSLEACMAELREMQISWRSDADKFISTAGLLEQPSDDLLKAIAARDGATEDGKGTTICAAIDVKASSTEGRVVGKILDSTRSVLSVYSCLVMNGNEVAFDRTAGHIMQIGQGDHSSFLGTALITPNDITDDD